MVQNPLGFAPLTKPTSLNNIVCLMKLFRNISKSTLDLNKVIKLHSEKRICVLLVVHLKYILYVKLFSLAPPFWMAFDASLIFLST